MERLQQELDFAIEKRFIEGDSNLEAQYGDKVPVIHIDDEPHSIFRVDPERFKSSLDEHRQRQ